MDLTKVDLNKPAFGKEAQKIEELTVPVAEETPNPAPQAKEEVEVKEEVSDPSVEEQKVPYSRFKKYHEEASQLRKEREDLLRQLEEKSTEQQVRHQPTEYTENEVPDYWKELYGDSDASKKAWQIQDREQQAFRQEVKEEAIRSYRDELQQEAQRAKDNETYLDEGLDNLSALVGRGLTDREQSAVLDIIDEYTPKDNDGNYAGRIIPFEKAWEIYELKNKASNDSKAKSRDGVAGAVGSQTQGETSLEQAERDKNWNPLDWDAWKKRI